jgi:hypothetical protein
MWGGYVSCIVAQMPLNEMLMSRNLLFALEPDSHLKILILAVSCTVSIFGQIYVKAFGVFSVEVVCWAEVLNFEHIMFCKVKLGEVKVISDTKVNKDAFVFVKPIQGILKQSKRLICVNGILC